LNPLRELKVFEKPSPRLGAISKGKVQYYNRMIVTIDEGSSDVIFKLFMQ